MKKCLASRYIKKADLQPEENERILQDLFAFNSMKRTSFLWQTQGRKFLKDDGKELSHQLKLKEVMLIFLGTQFLKDQLSLQEMLEFVKMLNY